MPDSSRDVQRGQHMNAKRFATNLEYDCIVVGAGMAGLAAADHLERAGRTVLVLEARDRLGGRLESGTLAGKTIDLGGMWVSPSQTAVHELLDRFGIDVYPTNLKGRLIGRVGTRAFEVEGEAYENGIGLFSKLRLGLAVAKIHRMLKDIDPQQPWASRNADVYDRQTVSGWAEREIGDATVRRILDFTVRSVFCAEPNELSLLFYLFYLKAVGGLEIATEGGPGGAQNHLCVGGLHQIAHRLAEDLQSEIRFSEHAVSVEQHDDNVSVRTEQGHYTARRVIIAIPPALVERIDFAPRMPLARIQLLQRKVMGSCIKVWVAYDRPFWRDAGFNGMIADDTAAFSPIFDAGPPESDIGLLAGFIEAGEADGWSERCVEDRKEMVISTLVAAIGSDASSPIDYMERDWTHETWSRGCYGAFMPPGALTRFGHSIRTPHQFVHWAGTETATEWSGYVDGAIRSGWRAAAEVLAVTEAHASP